MKRILWSTLSIALLAGMGWSIFSLVTRDAPTVPRAPDRAVAERVVVPPAEIAGRADAVKEDLRDPTLAATAAAAGAVIGGNGMVEPRGEEIAVASAVAGRVREVHVHAGQRVVAGDPLLTLEDASQQAAVKVAEAEVALARARMLQVTRGSRAEEVQAAVAEARGAEARAALSKGVEARLARLAAGAASTADEVERARRQAEADSFAATAAKARRQAVVNGSRAEDVAEAEAQVALAEGRLVEAKVRLDERVVRAPTAGEVLAVRVQAGEFHQPGGEAPVTLGETAHLEVRVDVDERDIARVTVGAKVRVVAKAFGDRVFTGEVVELGRRMGRKNVRTDDPVERNDVKILEVRVALSEGVQAGLIVGQRVTALIDVGGPVAAVPTESPRMPDE